jgi:hypothetical protein
MSANKRKNRWQEKKALKKAMNIPQYRKEFEKPHPGSYASQDLADLPPEIDDGTPQIPRKKVALLLVSVIIIYVSE